MSVDRYDFFAVYLVKLKFAFGAQYRNINTDESQKIGSVNGIIITTVVHGSPAAAAGVAGDIVINATVNQQLIKGSLLISCFINKGNA